MRAIGVILAGGNNQRLGVLTTKSGRAAAAMPMAGGYRAIDFSLSNMTNSGIKKVAVMVQFNSSSLHNHLSSSKWWDLGRKKGGLFIFSPYMSSLGSAYFRGTSDSMYQNIKFFKKSNEEFVVISHGDAIYKMDYSKVIQHHVEKENDITIVYKKADGLDVTQFGVLSIDNEDNILEIEEKPLETHLDNIYMGITIIRRELLMELLTETNEEGRHDFVRDILMRYRKVLKIRGYKFDGYWNTLNSVNSYYNTNMDFLEKGIRDFFHKTPPLITTKPDDEPPAKYNRNAEVKGSIVGGGSIIDGYIEKSIVFSRVYVGENTFIKNSIIMDGSRIGNNCVIENAIIDKNVNIVDGQRLIGFEDAPHIVPKSTN